MTHSDARELIAPYSLGVLDEPDLGELQDHLEECAFCANLAREAGGVVGYMAYAPPLKQPPPGSLSRLLASIHADPLPVAAQPAAEARIATPTSTGAHWWRKLVSPAMLPTAATLILALSVVGWNVSLMGQLHSNHSEMDALQSKLTQQTRLMVMLTSSNSVSKPLEGTALAPSAQVRLVMDGDSNSGMLMASRLPALEPKHYYQVWLGRQGARLAAGRLYVDPDGDGTCNLRLDGSVHSYDSAWITLEPEPAPMPNSPGIARGTL